MGGDLVFYTYAHYAPNGKIFYIGKGIKDRAYSFSDRSDNWKRAVKDNKGLKIEILAHWDTEQEAFEHEKVLIDCFADMMHPLVNKTKGGKGAYLLGTNNSSFPGFGQRSETGEFAGGEEGEFMTRVGDRPLVFR